MGKTLVIAEKPSVAADLAKVLPGRFKKVKNHYEGGDYLISWAVGHLVSIAYPEEIDPRYQKWDISLLPIIPEKFPLAALKEGRTQLNVLQRLMRRRDVDEIVNACDAGREGELIFKYILAYVKNRSVESKRVRRLWLQSMTRESILEAFDSLRDDEEMRPLEDTALCRSESDWLIGINATRVLTGYNSRFGGFRKTPCGRVQTPTLSLMVGRERERMAFQPRTYWELTADFTCAGVCYQGQWFDPDFKKDQDRPHHRHTRIWEHARAEEIIQLCTGRPAQVTEKTKKSTQAPPLLYDLTTLQREANSRFGFSAKNTLAIAQALYERHKLITYPRTDSRYLPGDYPATARKILGVQKDWRLGAFAAQALEKNYVNPKNRRIFNNAKVSDHHAIIPTRLLPKGLSEAEARVYQMIAQRFIAIFFPPAEFLNTRRVSVVEGEHFLTEGKVLTRPGWKAVYGAGDKDQASREKGMLEALPEGGETRCEEVREEEKETRPPPRFSEATLLSAMENSGRLVDDEELREAMKERGLGTPATRAAIIEKLLKEQYIVREGRDLVPTAKAFELLALLETVKIEVLASPELTGDWEYKLNEVLKGRRTREQFMREIRELTTSIVEKVKAYTDQDENDTRTVAPFSPVNGREVTETPTAWFCKDEEGREVMVRKVLGGRLMQPEEAAALLRGETIGPFTDFRSKRGKPFAASLRIDGKGKIKFLFADDTDNLDIEAITREEPLGASPIDGSPVYATPMAYMSASALEGDKKKGLRIGRTILGRVIEEKHVRQLLDQGKTELIKGFISKKRRPFDAYLLIDGKGKITFEFPPRKRGRARGATSKKSAA